MHVYKTTLKAIKRSFTESKSQQDDKNLYCLQMNIIEALKIYCICQKKKKKSI